MWICSMETMGILHVQCELGLSQNGRKGGWGFSVQFSGIIIFSIYSYYRDLSCSKSITKSFFHVTR